MCMENTAEGSMSRDKYSTRQRRVLHLSQDVPLSVAFSYTDDHRQCFKWYIVFWVVKSWYHSWAMKNACQMSTIYILRLSSRPSLITQPLHVNWIFRIFRMFSFFDNTNLCVRFNFLFYIYPTSGKTFQCIGQFAAATLGMRILLLSLQCAPEIKR